MSESSSSTVTLPDGSDHIRPPGPTLHELYKMSDAEARLYPPELLIAAVRLVWRSPAYDHFIIGLESTPHIDTATGAPLPVELVFTFTCKHDPANCKTQRRKRQSTGSWGTKNLGDAIKKCNQRRGIPENSPAVETEYSQAHFRALIAMWCAVNHRPFHIVSDPLFIDIVHLLRPHTSVPCPQTVSSDLTRIFNQLSTNVRDTFQAIETGMHLAIDGWTSPLVASFIGIILFWRQGGRLWRTTLDFVHLTEGHSGVYLAEKTHECLERLGVKHHIMSICLDNASNNNTLVRSIAPSLPNFRGAKARGRCVAHIANLVAQAFISPFTQPPSKKQRLAGQSSNTERQSAPGAATNHPSEPTTTCNEPSGEVPDSHKVNSDNTDDGSELPDEPDDGRQAFDHGEVTAAVAKALERMKQDYHVIVSQAELDKAREVIPKVNGFAHRILNSLTLAPTFVHLRNTCKESGSVTTKKTLPSAYVCTRWNSQLATCKTHLELQAPVEMMTASTNLGLTKYQLSTPQWGLLAEMCQCLEVLHEPTLIFSQTETPLTHEVLPTMHLIRFRLTLMRDDTSCRLSPVTRVAAYSALTIVDKYMKLLEESDLYFMATALWPWHKLQWFEDYKYPPRRIQGIREMLHNQFNQFYAHQPSTQVPTPGPSCPTTRSEPENPWMAVPVISRAAAPEMVTRTALNAIDSYLASPLTVKDKDAGDGGLMAHWTQEENLGSPIARMALDILTAPASSVDVERAFSGGRMAVNYRQHRMSLSTFRAKMALGAWYGTPLMPNIEEAVYVMNDGTTDHSEALDL